MTISGNGFAAGATAWYAAPSGLVARIIVAGGRDGATGSYVYRTTAESLGIHMDGTTNNDPQATFGHDAVLCFSFLYPFYGVQRETVGAAATTIQALVSAIARFPLVGDLMARHGGPGPRDLPVASMWPGERPAACGDRARSPPRACRLRGRWRG